MIQIHKTKRANSKWWLNKCIQLEKHIYSSFKNELDNNPTKILISIFNNYIVLNNDIDIENIFTFSNCSQNKFVFYNYKNSTSSIPKYNRKCGRSTILNYNRKWTPRSPYIGKVTALANRRLVSAVEIFDWPLKFKIFKSWANPIIMYLIVLVAFSEYGGIFFFDKLAFVQFQPFFLLYFGMEEVHFIKIVSILNISTLFLNL